MIYKMPEEIKGLETLKVWSRASYFSTQFYRQILPIMPAEEKSAGRTNFMNALSGKSKNNFKFKLLTANGEIRTVLLNVSPLYNSEGNLESVICISRDITELEESEKKLQMKNAQLIRSQRIESLGTLASGVAHDFNNLLQAILGFAEILSLS